MNKNSNLVVTPRMPAPLPSVLLIGESAASVRIETASRAELIAANGKLRAALARHRAMAHDLRDMLFSLDVPALFLDPALNIRAFTPAASVLFGLLPGDIGKPAAGFAPAEAEADLTDDCRAVLRDGAPIEREYQTACGAWFVRRAMPYRARTDAIEGAVVTFADISEIKRQAHELADAGDAAHRLDGLSKRQREILELVLEGHPSKNIAADLGISRRTVEGHRAAIMKKLGVKNLPALVRLAMGAAMMGANAGAAAPPPA